MDLKTALRFDGAKSLAFVGSGGKTTALFCLARELDPPVIVSASTHLAVNQISLADKHYIVNSFGDIKKVFEDPEPEVVLVTGPLDMDRTTGLDLNYLSLLAEISQQRSFPFLIEADGSRNCPLKAPAEYEPPIPPFVDLVVVVAGLSGLGKTLNSHWVHRSERFSNITGVPVGASITPSILVGALLHPRGGMKNILPGTRRVIMLNQADTPQIQAMASKMSESLVKGVQAVIVSAFEPPSKDFQNDLASECIRYLEVNEPAAGVILAAGGASRYGGVKQLLDWGGKPLVWHVTNKAMQAGFSPVIVMCGDAINQIQNVLEDLPAQLVHNPDWKTGQSSSVRLGIQALKASAGCGVFMLADQPQVPVDLLRALVDKHMVTRAPIITPFVANQRGNPVLFDRDVFTDLASLSGDVGGRSLFDKYGLTIVPWDNSEILFDVDRPEDYERLLRLDPW